MEKKVEINFNGRVYPVELKEDKGLNNELRHLYTSFEYLASQGKLKYDSNPPVRVYTASLPMARRYSGKIPIYAAFADKIDGEDAIVIHSGLSKPEQVALLAHEVTHKLFPGANESEVQAKSLVYLEQISRDYPIITRPENRRNFAQNGISPHEISREDYREAFERSRDTGVYGVHAGNYRRVSGLESLLSILGVSFIIISIIISSLNITGQIISENTVKISILGAIFLILGITLIYLRVISNKRTTIKIVQS